MVALDGVRGLAALAVAVFHLSGAAFAAHGYLGVDLFFLLSGFVVAMAYERELRRGAGVVWMFRVRMARLYPLYVVGLTLGALNPINKLFEHPLAFLAGMTMLPFTLAGDKCAYPFNAALWTLGLEMAASLIFASGGYRLTNRALLLTSALAGSVLLWFTIWNGNICFGFQSALVPWLGGAARMVFGFSLGVVAYRLHLEGKIPRLRVSPPVVWLLLTAVLLAPKTGWGFDIVAVLIVFPLLFLCILHLPQPAGPLAWAATWGGRLSFPLYVCHSAVAPIFIWLSSVAFGKSHLAVQLAGTFAFTWLLHRTVEPGGKALIERLASKSSIARSVRWPRLKLTRAED